MTGVKISALTAASALSGSETVPVVQNGVTVRATASQISAYASGTGNFLLTANNLSDVANAATAVANIGAAYTVETLAALKALTVRPGSVLVKGKTTANDGWGGVFVWIAGSSTTADDALVVQCTAGTAGRYKRLYSPGFFRGEWFSVFGDDSTDNASTLSAAITAIGALGGGELRLSGRVKIGSAVTILVDAVTLSGGNPEADEIVLTSTTADGIVIGSTTVAPIEVFIKNLGFESTVAKSAGASVRFRYCQDCGIENFKISSPFRGIEVNAGFQVNAEGGRIEAPTTSTGSGIYVEGNRDNISAGAIRGSDIYFGDITMAGTNGSEPQAAVFIVDFGGIWFDNVGGVDMGTPLLIAPGSGDIVEHFFSERCAWDNGDQNGALLQPAGGTIRRWESAGDWFGSNGGTGFVTAGTGTIAGLQFTNPSFRNNGEHGAHFTKGSLTTLADIYILNPIASGNSQDSSGVSSGLKFTGVDNFIVLGGRCGEMSGYTNSQKYNIELGAGNTNYEIEGVNVIGGATAPILAPDALSQTKVIAKCIGFLTANSGTGSIASGATTATVSHGLAVTPTAADFQIIFSEQGTSDYGRWWISGVTSTQFTLNVSADPGASNLDFSWKVSVP